MNHASHVALAFVHRVFAERPWALLAWPAVAMIVGTLARWVLPASSQRLAIVPRTSGGLLGIVTAPFLHANVAHLAANLPPFVVLGALVLHRGSHRFVETAVIVVVGGGVLTWLFARRGAHLGASGVVFGFFGYLIGLAAFTATTANLVVAGLVLLVYGGILAGLRPARGETSWEAHVFGLLVGLAKAWWLRR
jgi:membrane associated rhomboid family serine protease